MRNANATGAPLADEDVTTIAFVVTRVCLFIMFVFVVRML